ncbi:MAG: UvrD-helicase domain-containing protein, partial [Bacteroidota bacterium]
MLQNLKLISAGAGSGKTYRLTQEMTTLLTSGQARPEGIIATTFTKRAAAELRERVRVKLLREGMSKEANELRNALIGTVHGLGVKLLRRFAFEAGVSPRVDIIAE